MVTAQPSTSPIATTTTATTSATATTKATPTANRVPSLRLTGLWRCVCPCVLAYPPCRLVPTDNRNWKIPPPPPHPPPPPPSPPCLSSTLLGVRWHPSSRPPPTQSPKSKS